jgi:hypothetical protein
VNLNLAELLEKQVSFNEQRVAESLSLPAQDIPEETRAHFRAFEAWSIARGVRYFPAAPATVAAYLKDQPDQSCLAIADAINDFHSILGLASPVPSFAVRAILAEKALGMEHPRSWTPEDRQLLAVVDKPLREVLIQRERERDKGLRLAQNKLSEQRKQFEQLQLQQKEELKSDDKANQHVQ